MIDYQPYQVRCEEGQNLKAYFYIYGTNSQLRTKNVSLSVYDSVL